MPAEAEAQVSAVYVSELTTPYAVGHSATASASPERPAARGFTPATDVLDGDAHLTGGPRLVGDERPRRRPGRYVGSPSILSPSRATTWMASGRRWRSNGRSKVIIAATSNRTFRGRTRLHRTARTSPPARHPHRGTRGASRTGTVFRIGGPGSRRHGHELGEGSGLHLADGRSAAGRQEWK